MTNILSEYQRMVDQISMRNQLEQQQAYGGLIGGNVGGAGLAQQGMPNPYAELSGQPPPLYPNSGTSGYSITTTTGAMGTGAPPTPLTFRQELQAEIDSWLAPVRRLH